MTTRAQQQRLRAQAEADRGPLGDTAITRIYDTLAEVISPESDLEFEGPFELLVAVVLSAQTTDKAVNVATRQLYPVANTPGTIAALGVDGLKPYIRHIGLYNAKAKNVIALCEQLLALHDGMVPDDRAALEALPGVGRKTANVVLNVAFQQPTIAVDTHIHRVANRTGIAITPNVDRTEQVLLRRTPKRHRLHAHHYLLLHGRYTCVARRPKCGECAIKRWCRFPDKTDAALSQ